MPEDISKYAKYGANLPYPEPKVEKPNIQYANLLLKDYAGGVSEFTAVSLYSYQHFVSDGTYEDYAELLGGISVIEMRHLELLGETIKLLGTKPIFYDNANPPGRLWTSGYVNFTVLIKEMLTEDINSEMMAIENYKYHISVIDDKYIKRLLQRIIDDEVVHIKMFREMYSRYENKR